MRARSTLHRTLHRTLTHRIHTQHPHIPAHPQKQEYDACQSLELIRNITTTAISTITYLRNLFPEDCYVSGGGGGPSGLKRLKRSDPPGSEAGSSEPVGSKGASVGACLPLPGDGAGHVCDNH